MIKKSDYDHVIRAAAEHAQATRAHTPNCDGYEWESANLPDIPHASVAVRVCHGQCLQATKTQTPHELVAQAICVDFDNEVDDYDRELAGKAIEALREGAEGRILGSDIDMAESVIYQMSALVDAILGTSDQEADKT